MNFLPTQLGALTALTGNWTQTQLPRKQWCNHYTMNTWFVPSYIWFIAPTLCMVLKHGECKILYYLFWCTWEFQMDSRWWRWHMQLFGWHSWTWLWTKNKLFDFINQLNEQLIICFFFQQVSAVFGCSSSVCPFAHQDAKYLSEVCSSRTSCAHPQVNGTNQRKTYCMGQIQPQHALQQNQLKKHLLRPCSEPSFGLDNALCHASFRGSTEHTVNLRI